jgi:haloacetate dehalogenase
MFEGFSQLEIPANGTTIHALRAGSGPPVLLLHGYPQTHVAWHRVAPALAERFTVICADLRGYGDSARPASAESHAPYSKRVMAQDQIDLMRTLGFERFAVVGHDRGARVARRMALDHREAVSRLGLLDVVPTQTMYATLNQPRATTAWRYFFLIQPSDLPERMIGADPGFYLRWTFNEWSGTPGAISEAAFAQYLRCFDAPAIHASCEDYRAGATIDLVHDQTDQPRAIRCPVLILWSEKGLGSSYEVARTWRKQADDVRGCAIDSGHFLPEERPEKVAEELAAFIAK